MNTSATTQVALPAGTWRLDAVHSSVGFSVRYIAGRYRRGFASFDASLDTTGGEPQLEGSADVSSITIELPPFREHMLGEEFFDVARHPQLRFVSTAFRRDGDRVEVEAELTLRGVTKPLVATGTVMGPVEAPFTGARAVGVQLAATVDRAAFGFGWNADLGGGGGPAMPGEVLLEADLQFVLDE